MKERKKERGKGREKKDVEVVTHLATRSTIQDDRELVFGTSLAGNPDIRIMIVFMMA